MEGFRKTIRLRCTFCRSHEFALPYEGYSPPPGSFVVCANCGRENDMTSLLVTTKAIGLSIAEEYADQLVDEMTKKLKNAFRSNKFIKIK